MPRVSVVMPMYNAAAYADAAISSIREQTFGDLELLIIDDGSTDGSAAIAEGHARHDSRVVVHSIDHQGISHAMNFGLARCRGEYVAIMHADDTAAPNRIERQLLFLESNPTIGVLGTAYRIVDENGKLIARIANRQASEECRAALWSGYNCICNHSAMVRRQAFERAGPYVQELWPSEDYDMWLRMSEFTEIANLNECLETYRYHFENASYRRTLLQALTMVAALTSAESRRTGTQVTSYDVSWEGLVQKGVTDEALFAQARLLYDAYVLWAIELDRHDVAFRLAAEFVSLTTQKGAKTKGLEFLSWVVEIYALKRKYRQIGRAIGLSTRFGFGRDSARVVWRTIQRLLESTYGIDVLFSEEGMGELGPAGGFIDSVEVTIDALDKTSTVRVAGWSAELSPYGNQTMKISGVRNALGYRIRRQDRPDVAAANHGALRCGFEVVFDVQGEEVDPEQLSVAVGKPAKLRQLIRSSQPAKQQPLSLALTLEPPRKDAAISGYVDELTLVPIKGKAKFALRIVGWAPPLQPNATQTVTVHGVKKNVGRLQINRRERPDAAALNGNWLGSGFELFVEVENTIDLSGIALTITDESGVTKLLRPR